MDYSVDDKLQWNNKTTGTNATDFFSPPEGTDKAKLYLAVNICMNAKHQVKILPNEKGDFHDATNNKVYVTCCVDNGHPELNNSWKGWVPTQYLEKVNG